MAESNSFLVWTALAQKIIITNFKKLYTKFCTEFSFCKSKFHQKILLLKHSLFNIQYVNQNLYSDEALWVKVTKLKLFIKIVSIK